MKDDPFLTALADRTFEETVNLLSKVTLTYVGEMPEPPMLKEMREKAEMEMNKRGLAGAVLNAQMHLDAYGSCEIFIPNEGRIKARGPKP